MQEQTSSGLATTRTPPGAGRWVSSATQIGGGRHGSRWHSPASAGSLSILCESSGGPSGMVSIFTTWPMSSGTPHGCSTASRLIAAASRLCCSFCFASHALMAPWALSLDRHRLAWLGWFAPLALMVCRRVHFEDAHFRRSVSGEWTCRHAGQRCPTYGQSRIPWRQRGCRAESNPCRGWLPGAAQQRLPGVVRNSTRAQE